MAGTELFSNDATTTVTTGGTGAPTGGTVETWTVASSVTFPGISSTANTQCHVADPAAPTEEILVTNISGTTWTVTRGAEGTVPVAHTPGFTVRAVVSAGWLATVLTSGQPATGDLTGTWAGPLLLGAVNGLVQQYVQWSASVSTFPAVPGVLHLVSAAGGNVTLKLPPTASAPPGAVLAVKRADSSGNSVTVAPATGENVNGLSAGVTLASGQGRWFHPNAPAGAAAGTGWMSL